MIRLPVVFECDECGAVVRGERPVPCMWDVLLKLPEGWQEMRSNPSGGVFHTKHFCVDCVGVGTAAGYSPVESPRLIPPLRGELGRVLIAE